MLPGAAMIIGESKRNFLLFSLLFVLPAIIYLPGLRGPFVFDDYTNILNNDFVRIQSLDADSLYHAAYSLQAGPLHRPLPMLSFALNYYFAGSFADPLPFKLTNLVIHIINGLLIFWMMWLIFSRARQSEEHGRDDQGARTGIAALLAATTALLWTVHPINLTSVLYVVQRMAELSALFTILGLICYLKGRSRLVAGHSGGLALILLGLAGCGWLGLLSKENAVLLPIFILAIELTLYANEVPWCLWAPLPRRIKATLIVCAVIAIGVLLTWAINYALPGYRDRPFSMLERIMTEGRVLLLYISLILLPRVNAFGLQHDDIVISTSPFTPWTTLPSLVGLALLFVFALHVRKKHPLISLGILWFLVGHMLESTVLGLEIAHEHRNYLASLGVILVLVCVIDLGYRKLHGRKIWATVPLLAVIFAGTTFVRADQWSDCSKLSQYEALHHPNSPRAQAMLASLLTRQRRYDEALEAISRAAQLDALESGYLMTAHLIASRAGKTLPAAEDRNLLRRLTRARPTAYTTLALQHIGYCIDATCNALQPNMERWLRTIITSHPSVDVSFYYNLLGRTLFARGKANEAIDAFRRSYELDPKYLHPLFELASAYIRLGQIDSASQVLDELRRANKNNLHPRNREIEELTQKIEALRREHSGQS